MMFHQSMSRNQRAKGSKVKNIIQVSVLLAVVFWLLYQTQNSYDRKMEYTETGDNNMIEVDINFGRKVNAGSQNGFSSKPYKESSDESNKRAESGAVNGDPEEKLEEVQKLREESREEIYSGNKEENVDDNGDSHVNGEMNNEQEELNLHSQRNSDEENGHPENDAVGQNFTSNTDRESEKGESVETLDGIRLDTERSNNSTVEGVSENVNLSNSTAENNTNFPDSNGFPGRETVDAQEYRTSEGQVNSNSLIEVVASDTSSASDGDNANDNSSSEESNVVMSDNNGIPKGEKVESQLGNASDGEITDNSIEVKSSSDFSAQSVVSSEQDTSESLRANATVEEEKDLKSIDEVTNSSVSNEEHVELPAKRENATVEVKHQGNPGNNSTEVENTEQSDDKISNLSLNHEQYNSETTSSDPFNKEETTNAHVDTTETEYKESTTFGERNTEKSDDKDSSSSQKNEQSNSETISSETSNKEDNTGTNVDMTKGIETRTGSQSSSSEEELKDLQKSAKL